MDLKQVERMAEEEKHGNVHVHVHGEHGLVVENKVIMAGDGGKYDDGHYNNIDSGSALQSFLDHIPISSIPSIIPNHSVEIKPDDYVRDAISLLYNKNVCGAPIVDNVNPVFGKSVDRDIGFIEFSRMVLWSIEGFDKVRTDAKVNKSGFLSMLEQHPQSAQTKIAELAKSFLWEPFFPVNSNDSLFHVLLLFSKHHRLKVVPVVKSSKSSVVGFITENAVLQLLLQSSGLNWFDQIADKTIEEFGFQKVGRVFYVYGHQTLSETLHILWKEQTDGVPVIDQRNKTLMGVVRCSDIHRLLEDNNSFDNRKSLKVEEFINSYGGREDQNSFPSTKHRIGRERLSSGSLLLKDNHIPQMNTWVTNKKSDSLKHAMENLVVSNSTQSFLVDESGKLEGVVTVRDIISQFSPPSMDSRIDGGGFFRSALEQAGCYVEDGSIIRNH